MQKVYFLDGEAVTKTQLLCNAETASLKTTAKNKRRLREGLTFRSPEGYRSWGEFIGNCQQIGYTSVSNVNVKSIITKALDSREIIEPCIAIFRLSGQSFVYSERGRPVVYNARVFIERGGTWCKEEADNGDVLDWYLEGKDPDHTIEGEYLLVDKIDFPNEMSTKWRELCLERYGQVYDKYHIVPEI